MVASRKPHQTQFLQAGLPGSRWAYQNASALTMPASCISWLSVAYRKPQHSEYRSGKPISQYNGRTESLGARNAGGCISRLTVGVPNASLSQSVGWYLLAERRRPEYLSRSNPAYVNFQLTIVVPKAITAWNTVAVSPADYRYSKRLSACLYPSLDFQAHNRRTKSLALECGRVNRQITASGDKYCRG